MVKIAYLYYDILNLYGESGNVKALSYSLKSLEEEVNIDYLTIGDDIDFLSYDFIYIGSGTEKNQRIVLDDIMKYKDDIKEAINDGKLFLVTGNSLELFGKIIKTNDKTYTCLNIFDFSIVEQERIMADVYCNCSLVSSKVLGFENHIGKIIDSKNLDFDNRGYINNNFYGTYILGPILIRNPELLEYFLKKIVPDDKLKKLDLSLEEKTYEDFVNKYIVNKVES